MLFPVAPSGRPQPMMTSCTSRGATEARSSACLTACPAIVAPGVWLNAPRKARPIGVRAAETIAASRMNGLPLQALHLCKLPAALRHAGEQRRWFPLRPKRRFELFNTLVDARHAHLVGIPHRAAVMRRKAVPVHVDDVDIAWPQGDALFEQIRAAIDQRVD